ncbi:hypothetical protein AJQ09_01525 [Listeria seeligeri]|uniref:hypothetical protein n=1 Tax=Listeria seeligeri TaxID=1640 RepID=UPI00095171B1|nr:hypothetical protein [Listeria seeligeri]OLQ24462.1 hypothetical protein AJQ09_01525 [Listeria seeligeri]
MGIFFASFVNWLIGSPGRFVVQLIENNMLIFMLFAMLYTTTILYAKWTLTYYLPKKMYQLAKMKTWELEELHEAWQTEKKSLPWYILVPSRNEFWVKSAKNAPESTKLLHFSQQKLKLSDKEKLQKIIEIQS